MTTIGRRIFQVGAMMALTASAAMAQTKDVTYLDPKFVAPPDLVKVGFDPNVPQRYVGPYTAQFAGPPASSIFDVYCFDFDNPFLNQTTFKAYVLTFEEAVSGANFTALKRILGTTAYSGAIADNAGEYLKRLNASASLSTQFGALPNGEWDAIHVAIWRMFGDPEAQLFYGTKELLPGVGFGGTETDDWYGLAYAGASNTVNQFAHYRLILDANAWDPNYDDASGFHQATMTAVPEPGTYALMATGLLGVWVAARRRRSRSQQA